MGDVKYKEYTEAEGRIYDEAMSKIREGLKSGLNFNEATSVVNIEDEELKRFVVDDTLKIMIAEMHYSKGMTLPQVAEALKVSIKTIATANMEMMEDAGLTAAEMYRQENPEGPVGNA